MSCKKPFRYKLGKTEIEADESNKHAIRWANINTVMYWVLRILIAVLSSGVVEKVVMKLLDD